RPRALGRTSHPSCLGPATGCSSRVRAARPQPTPRASGAPVDWSFVPPSSQCCVVTRVSCCGTAPFPVRARSTLRLLSTRRILRLELREPLAALHLLTDRCEHACHGAIRRRLDA